MSRLDTCLTADDTATVCIAAGAAADYRITVSPRGDCKIELYENGVLQKELVGGSAVVRFLGTLDDSSDSDIGSVTEVAVPKALLGLSDAAQMRVRIALVNADGGETISDSMDVPTDETLSWPAVVLMPAAK